MEAFERLEQEFGRWAGVQNVVACASGTAALHLALEALRLPRGSAVIVPDFTMVACARAVTLAGLVPVFVDCGPDLLMDVAEAGELCRTWRHLPTDRRIAAIMAVHVYGRRVDMDAVVKLAGDHNLFIVEDLAEAHGVRPHAATDAACWSFYRNKIVAGEEGGACAFQDAATAECARLLRCLGFTPVHDMTHVPRGHNYRMSNLHAAWILGEVEMVWRECKNRSMDGSPWILAGGQLTEHNRNSLKLVEENRRERRRIEEWYDGHCPPEWMMPWSDEVWVYDFRVPGLDARRQDALMARLCETGIEARHGFKPMTAQEEYREDGAEHRHPNSHRAAREVIYLPVRPGVTMPEDCRRAFEVAREALA